MVPVMMVVMVMMRMRMMIVAHANEISRSFTATTARTC